MVEGMAVPGPDAEDTGHHDPERLLAWRHHLLQPYVDAGVVALWEERPHQNVWYVRNQIVVDDGDVSLVRDELSSLGAERVSGTSLPCARLCDRMSVSLYELLERVPLLRRFASLAAQADELGSTVFQLPDGVDVIDLVLRWRSDRRFERTPVCSPNHVVVALQRRMGFPDGDPEPGPGLPALPPAAGAAGEGVVVAVIDTGFVPEDKRSPDITWFEGDTWEKAFDEVDELGDPRLLDAEAGHGLFVGGLVKRVAPGVRLHFVKAINSEGVGTEQGVAAAVARAAALPALHVMNLSLGFATLDNVVPAELTRQIQRARARHRGLAIVAAAGNDGDTTPRFPAAAKDVISVGGLDRFGRSVSATSNRGPWVDVYAPSRALHSCFPKGVEDGSRTVDGNADAFDTDARWSGTSFAAPLVAGLVARSLSPGAAAKTAQAVAGAADRALDDLLATLPETPGQTGRHLASVTLA